MRRVRAQQPPVRRRSPATSRVVERHATKAPWGAFRPTSFVFPCAARPHPQREPTVDSRPTDAATRSLSIRLGSEGIEGPRHARTRRYCPAVGGTLLDTEGALSISARGIMR